MTYDLFQAPSTEPKFSNLTSDELVKTMDGYGMTAEDRDILMKRGYVSFDGTTLILQEAEDDGDPE